MSGTEDSGQVDHVSYQYGPDRFTALRNRRLGDSSRANLWWIFYDFGFPAPRTSEQQQAWRLPRQAAPGSLAFLSGDDRTPGHIGIVCGRPESEAEN